MGIKIKKIYIKNFKVYKEKTFDFDAVSLMVFDGPNGFGKTTVYDAIELLFTNQIKRYDRLSYLIDGREGRSENPLYNSEGTDGEIIIKMLFSFNDIDYVLAIKNSRANQYEINFSHYELYQLPNFDDAINESNRINDELLKNLLGVNYKQDFEFINYVEQEDTFYYLKSKEKDKKQHINYLFNTNEFNVKIDKYHKIDNKIKKLLEGDNGLDSQINLLIENIKKVEESYKKQDNTSYDQLFLEQEFEWDKEKIDFEKIDFNELFNVEDNTFKRLEALITKKEDFINFIHNKKVDWILEQEDLLVKFYYYEHFRQIEDKLQNEYEFAEEVNEFKKLYDEFDIDDILDQEFDISEIISTKHRGNLVLNNYSSLLEKLKITLKNANSSERIYSKIITTRENLTDHLLNYHKDIKNDGLCPLCGHDYNSSEILLRNIEEQKQEITLLNKNLNNTLEEEKISFLDFVYDELFEEFEKFTIDFYYDPEYFESDFFDIEFTRSLKNIKDKLENLGIDYQEIISKEIKQNGSDYDQFLEQIESNKKAYNENNIEYYFIETFKYYFSSNMDFLQDIIIEDLESKKQYIRWKYSVHQSNLLKVKKEELKKLTDKRFKVVDFHGKIQKIIHTLHESLSKYNSQLIKDIELLFHIYSGRIVQDFQGGLGLFIIDRGNKIKFVSAPSKTFDVVFSLSTGQLSALILSFTLALNKKYSKSKLLLIDDPVQSMDDINTAGFVELLRNDFSDRQIILSTHEQMLSTYIRYKFKKFNIKSSRIDLSKINNIEDV